MSKSFADVMASKKNGRRRTSELMCFSPTLADEYREMGVRLLAATQRQARASDDPEKPSTRRAGDLPEAERIAKDMEAFVEAHPDSFYEVVIEALEPAAWNALRAEHPPRDKVEADGGLYNVETFARPAIAASLVDPEPSGEAVDYLMSTLTNGETERLVRGIWNLNEGNRAIQDPKVLSAILGGSSTE